MANGTLITYKSTALAFVMAVVVIAVGELIINTKFEPTFWERTSWLLHDPYKGEPFDRLVLSEKLQALGTSSPDIITVGDSSGFFSLHPGVINRYLGGQKLVNISTGANQAFDGYYADAEYMLKRNRSIRSVVLYMHPNLVPVPTVLNKGDLGPIVATQINSVYGEFAAPPSAMFSYFAKMKAFTGNSVKRGDPLSSHLVYLQLRKVAPLTLGWMPEHDVRFPRFNGNPGFWSDRETQFDKKISVDQLKILLGLRDASFINYQLTRFADLCRRYGATPIIVFNPLPWTSSLLTTPVRETIDALERFSKMNPDVLFPVPYITLWNSEKFAMFNHVSREYVHLSSVRLARALATISANPKAAAPFTAGRFSESDAPAVSIGSAEPASSDEMKAALGFYLYTATAGEQYRSVLSKRVLSVLREEPGFDALMEETRRRVDGLESNKDEIILGYDTTQLQAEIVAVTGIKHCGKARGVKWVRLFGTMNFTYKSHVHGLLTEPVSWPQSSNILVPILVEDGKPKFDGYCTESL
jgi:hypothetical protein